MPANPKRTSATPRHPGTADTLLLRWAASHAMKMTILGMLAVALATVHICFAADTTHTDADTIQFGVTNSTLIVSGKFGMINAGGGGATGTAEIVAVFKAPKGFKTPKSIVVFWPSEKEPGLGGLGTNTFLLFLRPAGSATPSAYAETTEQKRPLVRASKENIGLLQSQLAKSK